MATSDSVKQHKLRKLIARLSNKEGREPEFISLYVPKEKNIIDDVVTHLKCESDSVITKFANNRDARDRFQGTFKNVVQRLKQRTQIPENGLAIFAGAFAENDSENELLNVEEIIPPKPITAYSYAVDNHFHLESLREMLRSQKVVGLVSMDSKEASFALLNGERFEIIESITSGIHGKSGKGGSSQRRYERERNMAITNYFHRVADHATKAFLNSHKVTALIVGGPGLTKEEFLKGNYLHYELQNALLKIVDTQFAGSDGLRDTLDKSSETLNNMCTPEEKIVVQRLLAYIGKQDNLATYGLDAVINALKTGAVEVALAADNTDMTEIVSFCKKCGLTKAKIVHKEQKVQTVQEIVSRSCERCNSVDYSLEEKDIIDVLEDLASQTDARIEVISTVSLEKARLKSLGGFGAILRYRAK